MVITDVSTIFVALNQTISLVPTSKAPIVTVPFTAVTTPMLNNPPAGATLHALARYQGEAPRFVAP